MGDERLEGWVFEAREMEERMAMMKVEKGGGGASYKSKRNRMERRKTVDYGQEDMNGEMEENARP